MPELFTYDSSGNEVSRMFVDKVRSPFPAQLWSQHALGFITDWPLAGLSRSAEPTPHPPCPCLQLKYEDLITLMNSYGFHMQSS